MIKDSTILVTFSLAALLSIIATAPPSRADIFQWQYINPGNPALGKQQSAALCPGGAGANALPGAYLPYLNLTKAYLVGAQLSAPIYYPEENPFGYITANLTGANLSQAELSNANLIGAALIGTNLSQANLANASCYGFWSNTESDYFYSLGADLTGADISSDDIAYFAPELSNWKKNIHITGKMKGPVDKFIQIFLLLA